MKIYNFIIFYACLAWGLFLTSAQDDQETIAFVNCLKEAKVGLGEYDELARKKDPRVECIDSCILKKLKIDFKDKKVNTEKAIEHYKKSFDNLAKLYQRASTKLDNCKTKGVNDTKNECQNASEFFECKLETYEEHHG